MPEQINAVSNVLYTGVDNLYQSRLDRKQSMDFIALVADRAKATTDQLSDTLNQALVKLDQRLAVIDRKAEIFDKP